MSYQIGDRIGDYQIVDVLGAGGMGKVYKVRNVISERVEAMKVLLPNLESDPDLADRFMREIKVQASLQHPNIAALHTAQRLNNQLVMLIEFVEGKTLEAELRTGTISVPKAVDYISQVLSALSYAHSHGVVHRDIKPANMMLTPSGTVKLMDFGIARLSADRRLTQTGRTVGSLYYMSPEQIQGALDLDARSDLYSLGVSLYELVTNRRPFQGDSDYSIMAAHLSANPVPPIQIDPSLPEMLNEVILMAIAKDPNQRFQTADAFRAALGAVAGSVKQQASSITKPVQPSVAAAAVAAAATPAAVNQAPPIPVASAPTPQYTPPAPAKSRRGLYMALGSIATVAVLAVAALQAPKFFGPSSAASPESAATSTPLPSAPAAATPETTPVAEAPAPTPTATTTVSVPPQPAATGNERPATSAAAKPQHPASTPSRTAASAPAAYQAPPQTPPATQAYQGSGYSAPAQQVQQPPQQPAVDSARIEALRNARETLMMLGTRANSAKSSLFSIKQQQARMGTNLRGDVLTAEQRMEFYLNDAEAAIRAGDPERAKKNLETAERALEAVEKFLGR